MFTVGRKLLINKKICSVQSRNGHIYLKESERDKQNVYIGGLSQIPVEMVDRNKPFLSSLNQKRYVLFDLLPEVILPSVYGLDEDVRAQFENINPDNNFFEKDLLNIHCSF